MTGYTVLAGALIFFLLFIYATWFGTQLKLEKQKDKGPELQLIHMTICLLLEDLLIKKINTKIDTIPIIRI